MKKFILLAVVFATTTVSAQMSRAQLAPRRPALSAGRASLQNQRGILRATPAAANGEVTLNAPTVAWDARDANGNEDGNVGWTDGDYPYISGKEWESYTGIDWPLGGSTASTGRSYKADCGDGLPCFENSSGASNAYIRNTTLDRADQRYLHEGPSSLHVLIQEYDGDTGTLDGCFFSSSTFTSSTTGIHLCPDHRAGLEGLRAVRYPNVGSTVVYPVTELTRGRWHLLSMENDDPDGVSPTARLYLDGELLGSAAMSDSATYAGHGVNSSINVTFGNANATDSWIGAYRFMAFYDGASGSHDNVLAYVRAQGLMPAALDTLPSNPEFYLSPDRDFELGALNDEEIGASQDVCPSTDSATTACLGQAFSSRRGNWSSAPGCTTGTNCIEFQAVDHIETTATVGNWDFFGEEPFTVHVAMKLEAVLTSYSEIFANRATTSGNVPGVLLFLDHRLGGRDIVARVGGATTQTELDANDCMLGIDETEPFIVTLTLRASSGADSIELYVNGVSCDTGVTQGFSPTVDANFGIPSTGGGQVAQELYAFWVDSETSAGDVATMETRSLAALEILAAKHQITLP